MSEFLGSSCLLGSHWPLRSRADNRPLSHCPLSYTNRICDIEKDSVTWTYSQGKKRISGKKTLLEETEVKTRGARTKND